MVQEGFSRPEQILKQLDVCDQMEVADFGCGHGYFSLPLAKMVPFGKVYAIDVVKETLEAVESKARLESVQNIKTIQANLEISGGSKLKNSSIDLVLLRNILYQSKKKEEILMEAGRVLRKGGQMILIEWKPNSPLAPKESYLFSKEEAIQLISQQGLGIKKELEIDQHHYAVVFKR